MNMNEKMIELSKLDGLFSKRFVKGSLEVGTDGDNQEKGTRILPAIYHDGIGVAFDGIDPVIVCYPTLKEASQTKELEENLERRLQQMQDKPLDYQDMAAYKTSMYSKDHTHLVWVNSPTSEVKTGAIIRFQEDVFKVLSNENETLNCFPVSGEFLYFAKEDDNTYNFATSPASFCKVLTARQ
jgi:hypothetical protein